MLIKPALLHFKFDGFADLPSDVDSRVNSDIQKDCDGNKWKLVLYPGGESDAGEQGWIGLYLYAVENNELLNAANRLALKNVNKAVAREVDFDYEFEVDSTGYGSCIFMKRDKILDPNNNILKNGALCIDVTVQVKDKKEEHSRVWEFINLKKTKLLNSIS